jgi:N,N-dimethylformamidase beta subunit-like, C-terminal/Domain of unknown function (DUF4082)/Malectin domain/Bacterial Ig-like domain
MAQVTSPGISSGRSRMRYRVVILALAGIFAAVLLSSAQPSGAVSTTAPSGVTGIALSSSIQLSWQPVAGASGYSVYRGTSPTTVTTAVTGVGAVNGTTYTDATVSNGTTYYYAVRAVASGVESVNSLVVQATPVLRGCSSGSVVVLENCYSGNTNWNVRDTATVAAGGIEGYATTQSVNKGGSIDIKVSTAATTTFNAEIYRSGYYGGAGARLFSVIRGVQGTSQPNCVSDSTTGLLDCSNWSVSLTITTTSNWPSGVYLLRLVRADNGSDNQVMFVVRDDSSHSDIVYGTAMSTFEAYNNYGGKSLYTFNSSGNTTVSGTTRAVSVSYDRPFEQPRSGLRDWYTNTEFATVYWLEEMGYDVSYLSNTDLETSGSLLVNHKTYISAAHDEYVSAGMRSAMQSARGAGVNLFFSGSNETYWKIRFENSPTTGAPMRIQDCYKTVESGGPDPSGISTSTWRDPNGPNQPENALSGEMYIGDNDTNYFPFVVSAAQGTDRIYRYTPLSTQAPGTSTSIGTNLVGWEWDARVANGLEPAGVKTLAGSPVTGELVQGNGAGYLQGQPATVTMVKYTAASGALVLTTGTNHWNRGLALNAFGVGEPDQQIQQITTNILEDMGAVPQTPAADITLDSPQNRPPAPGHVNAVSQGADSIAVSWSSVPNASGYDVYRALAPRQGGQPLGSLANAQPVTGTSFTDIGLASATDYYYVVTAVVGGVQSLASTEVHSTTAAVAGQATRINAGGPAYTSSTGATYRADAFFTGGSLNSTSSSISGTNDPTLYQTERWGQFTYAIPVANGIYDVRLHFAELYYKAPCTGKRVFGMDILNTPASPDLSNIDICKAVGPNAVDDLTVSRVSVTNGTLSIKSVYGSADDPEVTSIEVIPDAVAPSVIAMSPVDGAKDIPVSTAVTATFSEGMTASTLTSSTFKLTAPGGTTVPAAVTYNAGTSTATLTPTNSLSFGTVYTATVTTGARASDGTPLAGPVTWSFTTHQPHAPGVTSTFPAQGASGISSATSVHAVFDQPLDPSTVTSSSFTLTGPGGALAAAASYDATSQTATLVPQQLLANGTTYTATLSQSISGATEGVNLSGPVSWSFTTAASPPAPPSVTLSPAAGATGVAVGSTIQAVFSRAMYAPSISGSEFSLSGPGGSVASSVAYDASSRTATLTPSSSLVPNTTYTATLDSSVAAADGTPLGSPITWSFTTIGSPSVTSVSPSDGSTYTARSTPVTATFSRAMDGSTITSSSFTVSAGGSAVAATVAYDAASRTATLTSTDLLAAATTYSATVDTTVKAADGTPLTKAYSWTFTTAACPCSIFPDALQPDSTGLSTQDGRSGSGPFTYELGTKFTVDEPMQLTSFRFYKSPGETGTHTGNLWSAAGTLLAHQQFSSETDSGWQTQALATPYALQPGTVYALSVNANAFFVSTLSGLATQLVSGPVRTVADGANGVFASAAGSFPTESYSSSNYFADGVFVPNGDPGPLGVVSTTPAAYATGVPRTTTIAAEFTRNVDSSTLTPSTFQVTSAAGAVSGTISYNAGTQTATFTPSAALDYNKNYSVLLTTGIRASDGVPLGASSQWSFTTADQIRPQVVRTVPTNGATDATPGISISAVFSKDIDPTSLTPSTFTLTGPSGPVAGAVSYDSPSLTATFSPSASITAGATYTAQLAGTVEAVDGTSLGTPYSWIFTVASSALPPPSVTATSPTSGATYVPRSPTLTATVSRSLDPATVNPTTVTLATASGTAVPSSVSYNDATKAITLTPNAQLASTTSYTATVSTGVKAIDGTPFTSPYTWSFSTGCPCSLFSSLLPASTSLPAADGRTGAGPFTLELGVKVTVNEPTQVTAISFFKSPGETGTHVGTIWTPEGIRLTQVAFTGETASGWQTQALQTPYTLQPGGAYVISVNTNSYFVMTRSGLASQAISGPLSTVADGQNGVFSLIGGTFPNQSYSSSNYFIDLVASPSAMSPPTVTATSPTNGATGVASTAPVTATFSRGMDATSLSGSTATLTGPNGLVAASVSYDPGTSTLALTPAKPLSFNSVFTARIDSSVRASDGSTLASPYSWSFTTAAPVPPQVTSTVPAAGTSNVDPGIVVRADFSKPLDPTTVNGSTFTLSGPSGAVPGSVSYSSTANEASLAPSATLPAGSYTARLAGSVAAMDGATLGSAYTWTFTVTPTTVPLTVAPGSPASGASGVARDSSVTAVFSRAPTASTVTSSSFQLRGPGGVTVAAAVAYDPSSLTATLTPSSVLAASTGYTVQLTNAIRTDDGTSLSGTTTWTFTTGVCPCSVFPASAAPSLTHLPTRDGRSGAGPWTYELGMKFTVDSSAQLTAIRFYKDPNETGTHTGTLWTSDGKKVTSVTFASETASGWQQQALSAPVSLQPGVTYVVSVNANAYFVDTPGGLSVSQGSGPVHSVVGSNGVFGAAAGVFPTQSYNSSNYFVDVVVE